MVLLAFLDFGSSRLTLTGTCLEVAFLFDAVFLEEGFSDGVEKGTYSEACLAGALPLSLASMFSREEPTSSTCSVSCSEGPAGLRV